MGNISENLLRAVEKVLDIKLYNEQKNYLLNDGDYWFGGRQSGKTTAYCIKLALSDGPPLDMSVSYKWCDNDCGTPTNKRRYSDWFRGCFLDIWTRLKDAGFMVRDIKRKR